MNIKMKANRNAPPEAADRCDPLNPFCAAHPQLSDQRVSHAVAADSDERKFRSVGDGGLIRAHVRAEHVIVTKKKK